MSPTLLRLTSHHATVNLNVEGKLENITINPKIHDIGIGIKGQSLTDIGSCDYAVPITELTIYLDHTFRTNNIDD